MANEDIIKILKEDPDQAWRLTCGGCTLAIPQLGTELTAENLVGITLNDKPLSRGSADNNKQAVGILCDACLDNEQRRKAGPASAVFIVDNQIRTLPVVYLVEAQTTEGESQ